MIIDTDTPEGKAALQAQIEEVVTGLKTKNNDLLAKITKLQKTADVDPAEVAALQSQLDEANTKLADALKAGKALTADVEKYKKAAEGEQAFVSKLLIDNGLNDELTKAGVKPEFMKAAKAMIGAQVTLKQDGDNRLPVVGDKALSDFTTEWAKSDEGKHFVVAPQNGGGGAGGGKGGGAMKKFNEYTGAELVELRKTDPATYDRLKAESKT